MELNQEYIVEVLKKIQKNTEAVPIIQEKLEKLEKFEREHPHTTIELVKNNRELDDVFTSSALERFKAYLDSDEARRRLSSHTIKEIKDYLNDYGSGKGQVIAIISEYFRAEYLKATIWVLGVFGILLTTVFTYIVKYMMGIQGD